VGVGFSYSNATNPTADYTCTDDTAAIDNMNALKNFFTKFPEFNTNHLYITGESYAGVYVPTLAEAILQDGDWAKSGKYPPLKGIAVGNGCSGNEVRPTDMSAYIMPKNEVVFIVSRSVSAPGGLKVKSTRPSKHSWSLLGVCALRETHFYNTLICTRTGTSCLPVFCPSR
jgi:carboxypeptidase C (cathepsin A)